MRILLVLSILLGSTIGTVCLMRWTEASAVHGWHDAAMSAGDAASACDHGACVWTALPETDRTTTLRMVEVLAVAIIASTALRRWTPQMQQVFSRIHDPPGQACGTCSILRC